jgi:methyltransferase family protein
MKSVLARLDWYDGHARLGDVDFVIQEFGEADHDPDEGAGSSFVLYKNRFILGLYDDFFASVPDWRPRRIFELGIFRAGSAVLMAELFAPDRLVAVDFAPPESAGAATQRQLVRWLETDDHAKHVRLHWNTDQSDVDRLRALVREELGGTIDFVIDDASHRYEPSVRSFEALFPYVNPGGWYVLEDWSWAYNPTFQDIWHPFVLDVPLTQLVSDFVLAAAAAPTVISAVRVAGQIAFVQRGPVALDDTFRLSALLPPAPPGRRTVRARRAAAHLAHVGGKIVGPRATRWLKRKLRTGGTTT